MRWTGSAEYSMSERYFFGRGAEAIALMMAPCPGR
jgi:hypothetical protein